MQETLETAALFGSARTRVYLAPEGVAISRRHAFSPWEEPRLLPFASIDSAAAAREGRRWNVTLQVGEEQVQVQGLTRADAEWMAGLIRE